MRAWYFSENAYPYLPDPATYESIRVTLPNRYFDPKIGAELYHRYLDEWQTAEDLGLDLMLNEHHSTATNLNPSAAIVEGLVAGKSAATSDSAGIAEAITKSEKPRRMAREPRMMNSSRYS